MACSIHEQQRGHYPTGGWGHAWVGIPDRGFDNKQPGGWIFNILPFMEQNNIYELGRGLSGTQRASASAQRLATPIPLMNCPTRRSSAIWPTTTGMAHLRDPRETSTVMAVARSDFAINAGSVRVFSSFEGPATLAEGDQASYVWPDTSQFNGVSYLRSQIGSAAVGGRTTHTYLVGEKYLSPTSYYTGADPADNESMYNGFCSDLHRYANEMFTPMQDRANVLDPFRFGSAHPGACNFAFCDGGVRPINYNIDPQLHACYGSRETECSMTSP
jgi:prepilin-type processing-associated H-X9-DG protein